MLTWEDHAVWCIPVMSAWATDFVFHFFVLPFLGRVPLPCTSLDFSDMHQAASQVKVASLNLVHLIHWIKNLCSYYIYELKTYNMSVKNIFTVTANILWFLKGHYDYFRMKISGLYVLVVKHTDHQELIIVGMLYCLILLNYNKPSFWSYFSNSISALLNIRFIFLSSVHAIDSFLFLVKVYVWFSNF